MGARRARCRFAVTVLGAGIATWLTHGFALTVLEGTSGASDAILCAYVGLVPSRCTICAVTLIAVVTSRIPAPARAATLTDDLPWSMLKHADGATYASTLIERVLKFARAARLAVCFSSVWLVLTGSARCALTPLPCRRLVLADRTLLAVFVAAGCTLL